MFKKDSVKKTEHLEVQGMDRPLTDHHLVGGSGASPSCLWPLHLGGDHAIFCSLIFLGELQRIVAFQIKACLVQR